MSISSVERPVSALRRRMLEDMAMRGLRSDTQREYIRFVRDFAAFLGRPPDTATAEDIRRFQVHQSESGVQPPTINCSVSALRFFFTVTLDRPDLSRRLILARYPRCKIVSNNAPTYHALQDIDVVDISLIPETFASLPTATPGSNDDSVNISNT